MINKDQKHRISILDACLWLILGMVIGWAIMLWKQNSIVNTLFQEHESRFSKFNAIDYLLQSEYYDQDTLSGSYDNMVEWALAGYVDGLNDPYTIYLKEEENTELNNELSNEAWFAWIWAVIEKNSDNYVQIASVIKKSPAAKAWLLPLDRIYMVEDITLEWLSVSEAVDLIRWEKWTEVNLLIRRAGKNWSSDMQFRIPVVRDDVTIPSVTSEVLTENDKTILYLEISIISEHTTSLLLEEVRDALETTSWIDWMILDLRWNSWWYLEEAIKLLWHFFPKWTIVSKSKYQWFADIDHESTWRWELKDYPLVVIADQLTASAWEIIALALQESWAPVIWMQTFGKGSIQSVQDFKDWSSLKYTIWKWYSPNDINIDQVWITPDIEVKWDSEKYQNDWIDNQLEVAKDELLKLIK